VARLHLAANVFRIVPAANGFEPSRNTGRNREATAGRPRRSWCRPASARGMSLQHMRAANTRRLADVPESLRTREPKKKPAEAGKVN
jgi:hypothetical protein